METSLTIAQIGFVMITIVYSYLAFRLFFSGISKTNWSIEKQKRIKRNSIIGYVSWIAILSYWSISGIMGDFSIFPFNFMPVLLVPFITIITITFSSNMKDILLSVHESDVLQLQSFRIFVEILLWVLFIGAIIPIQMSFEGRNFDILVGLTAPIVAWLFRTQKISRKIVIAWNIVSILILLNIVTIAILSAPSPIRVFMNEPANTIVATFPVVLLPGILVPMAYALHFFSLRQLSLKR